MAAIPVPPVHRIVFIQLAVAVAATLAFFLVDRTLAISILAGALSQIVPQAYFNWAAFRYRGARHSPAILRQFYKGESGKLVLTMVLFATVFSLIEELDYPAFFLSFLGMMATHMFFANRMFRPTTKN